MKKKFCQNRIRFCQNRISILAEFFPDFYSVRIDWLICMKNDFFPFSLFTHFLVNFLGWFLFDHFSFINLSLGILHIYQCNENRSDRPSIPVPTHVEIYRRSAFHGLSFMTTRTTTTNTKCLMTTRMHLCRDWRRLPNSTMRKRDHPWRPIPTHVEIYRRMSFHGLSFVTTTKTAHGPKNASPSSLTSSSQSTKREKS